MQDHLVRGIGFRGRVRVVAAVTTDAVEDLRRIHEPTRVVTAALGRLATGALLLAASLEKVTVREPMLTLEVEGGGPVGRMFATASPAGWVRALAANPGASAPPTDGGHLDVPAVVGCRGHMVVTRDQGIGEPYRGVVPLHTGEIAQDLAWYLTESEQTPSAVVLGLALGESGLVERAGGFILQLLPGVSELQATVLQARIEELGALAGRIEAGDGPEDWCRDIMPDTFEPLERLPVEFRCGCSTDRVLRALKLLGAAEIRGMLAAGDAGAELTCEFCRTVYPVDRPTLESLLAELEGGIPRERVN